MDVEKAVGIYRPLISMEKYSSLEKSELKAKDQLKAIRIACLLTD